MNIKKAIPLNEFTEPVEAPMRQKGEMSVSILKNGHFNLNGRLTKTLAGKKLDILFTKDYQHMCLQVGDRISCPKSGSCKLPECAKKLTEKGIEFPAKYVIWVPEGADYWQGDLIENPTLKRSGVPRSSKKN